MAHTHIHTVKRRHTHSLTHSNSGGVFCKFLDFFQVFFFCNIFCNFFLRVIKCVMSVAYGLDYIYTGEIEREKNIFPIIYYMGWWDENKVWGLERSIFLYLFFV